MRRALSACALLAAIGPAFAQEKPTDKPPPPGPADVEVQFTDGSLVKLTLLDAKVEIATRYGKLLVPLNEIRRIELGVRYPEGALEKIQSAITRLNDADFKKREQASNELLSFRELAWPHVRRAAQGGNPETVKRAKALLEELRSRVPEEKLALKELDTVTTMDFPIAGHIELPAFKARSPLLGDVDVKLVQARTIRWLGATNEASVTLDAARYSGVPTETWMETGIEVNGDRVSIQASGTVDVMPNNPGQFMSGPDGMTQNVGFRGGRPPIGRPGALIGRVGNGQPFLVGSKYEGSPAGEGKLQLRLEPSPWGVAMSGNFSVKIVTGR